MEKDKRPLGGIIEDHYLGTQGVYTGGLANDIGLQERKRKQQQNNLTYSASTNSRSISKNYTYPDSPPLTKYEFENRIAGFMCLALMGLILYFGLIEYKLQWYFPVGAGVISAFVVYKILTGPLRILLRLIRWALVIAFFAGTGYVLMQLFKDFY